MLKERLGLIETQWLENSTDLLKQQDDLGQQITATNADIDSLRESKAGGFFNFAVRFFNWAVRIPYVKFFKLRPLKNEKRGVDISLRQKAAASLHSLIRHVVDTTPKFLAKDQSLRDKYTRNLEQRDAYQEIIDRINQTLGTIDSAISTCNSAASTERMNAFNKKNKGMQVLSHMQTGSAASALRRVEGSIDSLNKYLEAKKAEYTGKADYDVAGIIASNNFDFMMDILGGGMLGTLSSLATADRLSRASRKLRETRTNITPIRANFQAAADKEQAEIDQIEDRLGNLHEEAMAHAADICADTTVFVTSLAPHCTVQDVADVHGVKRFKVAKFDL